MNDASDQLRWSSVSNVSPSIRTSTSTPGVTSCRIARTLRNGWCGATRLGKEEEARSPSTVSTMQGRPAQASAGWSTQKPMRLRRKVDPAAPSIEQVMRPSVPPWMRPTQSKRTPPRRWRATKRMRKASGSASISRSSSSAGTVAQPSSRTAT